MLLLQSDINHNTIQDESKSELGRLEDVLFDDSHWTIRYLDINTGGWLFGRRVLISPFSVSRVHPSDSVIMVSLSKEQIENSPALDEHEPVSKQYEHAYHSYFGYPGYWVGTDVWGMHAFPLVDGTSETLSAMKEFERENKNISSSHLRSMNEVIGYDIHASDGHIGHVTDFLFDSDSWEVRYLLVDTRQWLPGPSMLLSPAWIEAVSWHENSVKVDVTKQTIKDAPKFNMPLTRDDELAIFTHFQKAPYWNSFNPNP